MAKSDKDKQAAATRASLELFLLSADQERVTKETLARQKELEIEVGRLKSDLKSSAEKASKLDSEKKAADLAASNFQSELARQQQITQDKEAIICELEEKVALLNLDVEDLENDKTQGWQHEKERITKESFEDGVKAYCRTFLAGDSSYDWRANFGERMASFMADFALKETEAIAARRAELEQAKAAEGPVPTQEEIAAVENSENIVDANQENVAT